MRSNLAARAIMEHIGRIIADCHASTFTVTGYPHLKTRLVLHYEDCDMVFQFRWDSRTEYTMVRKYYGEPRSYIKHCEEFDKLANEEIKRDDAYHAGKGEFEPVTFKLEEDEFSN